MQRVMEKNQKFLFLEAIAILSVIAGHTGVECFNFFPNNSFNIMLFFFISGYFYRPRTVLAFLRHKAYHLLLPLFLWNLFYGLVVSFLRTRGLIGFGEEISFWNLFIEPFIFGHQFMFNLATWFVGALFFVQFTYLLLRKVFDARWEFPLFGIFLLLSLLTEWVGMRYELLPLIHTWHGGLLILLRTGYHLLFYHAGYLYRQYEVRDRFSLNHVIAVFAIAGGVYQMTGGNVSAETLGMRFHTHVLIFPVISAFAGIYLWLQIAEVVQPYMKKCIFLQRFGSSTFLVMVHHLFFVWLVNAVLYQVFLRFPSLLPGFDAGKVMTDLYYKYLDLNIVYFGAGVIGSFFVIHLYDIVYGTLKNWWRKRG